ncbi:hypothetical protein [Nonomuraea sp. NPDC001023]|uniref:hypothetical protein n=1 Tax=unclassified Nonomuraea TaxID=2593643 RepID=UPI003326BBD7
MDDPACRLVHLLGIERHVIAKARQPESVSHQALGSIKEIVNRLVASRVLRRGHEDSFEPLVTARNIGVRPFDNAQLLEWVLEDVICLQRMSVFLQLSRRLAKRWP